jgi:hypothetical protein
VRTLKLSALLLPVMGCLNSSDDEDSGHPHRSTDTEDTESGGGEGGGESGDEGGESGDEGGEGGGPDPFLPDEGAWNFVDGSIVSDSCNYDYDELPSGGDGFTLTRISGRDFKLLLDGADTPFDCAWDDQSAFLCDPAGGEEAIEGLDAAVTSQTLIRGMFTDGSSMSSTYVIDIDCVGGDCGWVELGGDIDFPCSVELELAAESEQ